MMDSYKNNKNKFTFKASNILICVFFYSVVLLLSTTEYYNLVDMSGSD